jgi:hypothetical protein
MRLHHEEPATIPRGEPLPNLLGVTASGAMEQKSFVRRQNSKELAPRANW